MENPRGAYGCAQVDCPIKINGLCLEGLNAQDCTFAYILPEEYDTNEDTNLNKRINDADFISIYSGDELLEEELTSISYKYRTRLILIMGEPNSGKTTLIASLFDLFQKGGYGGYIFAGSRTQLGFEKRCHLARLSSGRLIPDTERTRSNDFHFLHLAVKNEKAKSSIEHLLFADISGEQFRLARDYDEEMKRLNILNRADVIFCIADGALLVEKKTSNLLNKT